MNFVNKLFCIILLFFLNSGTVVSQELDQQYEYAISLFNSDEYFDAVTEFKRLLFFDTTGKYSFKANLYIADSYKAGARFSDAISYYGKALASAPADEKYATKIEILKSNILRRSLKQAHYILNDLEKGYGISRSAEIHYWRGWVYMFEDQWDRAAESFIKGNHEELAEFSQNIDNERYSVSTAKVMSYLLPGAGQFYTGNYLSGLLSLGWNVLWGYITINSFIEERIFDGFITANFLWLRFYNGNVYNAEKFAVEKNQEISSRALRYLQKEYKGQKP